VKKKTPKILTLSERIDQFLATVPRSRPWYNSKEGRWEKGHPYITKRAVFALFMEYRRARAQQAMAELDAEIAAKEAAIRDYNQTPKRRRANHSHTNAQVISGSQSPLSASRRASSL
jgi:hypothetical protein